MNRANIIYFIALNRVTKEKVRYFRDTKFISTSRNAIKNQEKYEAVFMAWIKNWKIVKANVLPNAVEK